MTDIREMLLNCGRPLASVVKRAALVMEPAQALLLDSLLNWAAHLRATRGLSLNTVTRYLEAMVLFSLWLAEHEKLITDVSPLLVDEWQRDIFVTGKQHGDTRAVKLTALKQYMAWREEMGGAVSPVRRVRGPKKPKRIPKKYSRQELADMFAVPDRSTLVGKRDYALMLALLCTGGRLSEITGMRLEHLKISTRAGAVEFFGKGSKERRVPFEGPLIQALVDWLEARQKLHMEDESLVWCSLKRERPGTPLTGRGVVHLLGEIRTEAKIRTRVHAHKFRVTFATELYDAGNGLEDIRILLGHETIETTRLYIAAAERSQSVKLKARDVRILTGEKPAMPLWLAAKVKKAEGEDGSVQAP